MTERMNRLDLAMVGVLAVAVVLLFWRAATLQGTLFVEDMMFQNYPFRDLAAQALRLGHLPLWTPAINCGFPLFAEGQAGVLYPPNLIASLCLSTGTALNYAVIGHLFLAAAATYSLVRLLGAVPAAALVSGLCYSCGGYLVVRATSPNFLAVCAWLPALLALLELAVVSRRWVVLVAAAGVVGLQLLAGHPQAALYGAIAASAYGLYRGLTAGLTAGYLVALTLAVPLLGAGLAAVQLLPTAELLALTPRGTGLAWDDFAAMSLPPERLLSLLLPNAFGADGNATYWGSEAGFYIQLCAYGGVIPVLLALVAIRERRDPATRFFAALCVVALVLALGRYTALFTWLYQVPGMSMFRIPTRFLLWYAIGLAVLAGLGADRLFREAADRRLRRWWLLLLPIAAAGAMAWLNRDLFLGWAATASPHAAALGRYRGELATDLVRLVVLSVAVVTAVARRRPGRGTPWAPVVLPLLLYADAWTFGADANGVIDARVFTARPASAEAIIADRGPGRVVPPRVLSLVSERNAPYDWHGGWALDQRSYRVYPETLRMYAPAMFGLAGALPGWSPLHLQRHWEFVRGYPAVANLAGVDYVVSHGPLQHPGLTQIHQGEVRVYRNESVLPHAWVVPAFRVVTDPDRRLAVLRSPDFDPRREVLLERAPAAFVRGSSGSAQFVAYEPDRAELQVEAPNGGLLVLADTDYPGWQAQVDGVATPIMRANHVFRAVALPAGARQVAFTYQPDSWVRGVWVSGLCLLAAAAAAIGLWRRRAQSVEPRWDAAQWPLAGWALQAALVLVVHALATRWPLWATLVDRCRVLQVWGS